jgi:hypothetical protein
MATKPKAKVAAKPGRKPNPISDAVLDSILTQISDGKSVATILKQKGMPSHEHFYKRLREDKSFADRYARAKDDCADVYAEDIVDIADEPAEYTEHGVDSAWVQRQRMRIDARKWVASKLKPKKYGDKIEIDQKTDLNVNDKRESLRDKVVAAAIDAAKTVADKHADRE